jgi:PEP-CTERM motif
MRYLLVVLFIGLLVPINAFATSMDIQYQTFAAPTSSAISSYDCADNACANMVGPTQFSFNGQSLTSYAPFFGESSPDGAFAGTSQFGYAKINASAMAPEPTSLALMGGGLICLASILRRRLIRI